MHQGTHNNRNNVLWNTTSIRLCLFKQLIALSKSYLEGLKSTQENRELCRGGVYAYHTSKSAIIRTFVHVKHDKLLND